MSRRRALVVETPVTLPRLHRLALLAAPLALFLVLAAAGAVSAAEPGLGDAVPPALVPPTLDPRATINPVVTQLKPVKDSADESAAPATGVQPAKVVVVIVRQVRNHATSVVDKVPPVAIPAVSLLEALGASRPASQARRPEAAAAVVPSPLGEAAQTTSADAAPVMPAERASQAARGDAIQVTRLTPQGLPVEPDWRTSDSSIDGSSVGPGPWLAQLLPLLLGFAWKPGLRPALSQLMPRGLTPRLSVPPG